MLWVCVATMFLAFKKINDVLDDVGTTREEVKRITLQQIASNHFDIPSYTAAVRDACRKLPPGVREATMLSLGQVVRDYVESPEFEKDYFAYLEAPKPSAGGMRRRGPAPMDDEKLAAEKKKRVDQLVASMESPDILKMYVENLDAQTDLAKSMIDLYESSPDAKLPKTKQEYKKDLEDLKKLKQLYSKDLDAFKKQYAEIQVDQQLSAQVERDKARAGRNQKQAEDEKKQNELLKDYKPIIRKELQQFLAVSSNVDYNAQLTKRGDKMVFVNPAYEAKSAGWKLCYRCGKEAVNGARKFAQDWLKSMK